MSATLTPPPVVIRRNYSGWFVLVGLLILMMASTLLEPQAKANSILDYEKAKESLRYEFVTQAPPAKGALGNTMSVGGPATFDADLAPKRFSDPKVAAFYAAFLTEEGKQPTEADLSALLKSKDPSYQRIAQVYERRKLTRPEAARLTTNLDVDPFLDEAVQAQALARAGDPSLANQIGESWLVRLGLVSAIVLAVLIGSLCAWIVFILKKTRGELRPLGFAADLRTFLDADRLAMLAALLVSLFLIAQIVVALALIHVKEGEIISQFLLGVIMLVGVPLLLAGPVMGRRIRLAGVGFVLTETPKLIWTGFVVFLMEWPVAVGLALVGDFLFSRFHQATHPVTVELLNSPTLLTILAAFFLGAIVAPFWEEIMFRGLMFPALARVTKSPIWGGAISSFIFGALHPQGLPLWMTLMTIGAASCALSYHTKSLVPSMTMHFCHNAFTLVLSLLVS